MLCCKSLGKPAILLWILLLAPLSYSQIISIGSGACLSLGDGKLGAGCGELVVEGLLAVQAGRVNDLASVAINSGTVKGGTGRINLSGDWSNQGKFRPQSGTVNITDGCGAGRFRVSGDSDFNRLLVSSSSGTPLQFAAGSSQTVSGALSLNGAKSSLMPVSSSAPGSTAELVLEVGASQDIFAVDVTDIDSAAGQTIAPGPPEEFSSVDSGNNTNWFIAAMMEATPVDTLPNSLIALLALLLMFVGSRAALPGRKRLSSK